MNVFRNTSNSIKKDYNATFDSLYVVGMWANRLDMKDSAEWVRKHRKKEAMRNTLKHKPATIKP